MRDPGSLKYHQQTFELLGKVPRTSVARVKQLNRWQSKNNCKLPEALLEWYSLEDSEKLLETEITDFLAQDLDRVLGDQQWNVSSQQQHLIVGYWSGGASLEVSLTKGNDPLLFTLATSGSPSLTFSQFAFQQSWTNKTQSFDPVSYIKSIGWQDRTTGLRPRLPAFNTVQLFGPREIRGLSNLFSKGNHFCSRGKWVAAKDPFTNEDFWAFQPISYHRFFSSSARLQIFSNGSPKSRTKDAFWNLSADTVESLKEAASLIVQSKVLVTPFTLANALGKGALRQHQVEFVG